MFSYRYVTAGQIGVATGVASEAGARSPACTAKVSKDLLLSFFIPFLRHNHGLQARSPGLPGFIMDCSVAAFPLTHAFRGRPSAHPACRLRHPWNAGS